MIILQGEPESWDPPEEGSAVAIGIFVAARFDFSLAEFDWQQSRPIFSTPKSFGRGNPVLRGQLPFVSWQPPVLRWEFSLLRGQ